MTDIDRIAALLRESPMFDDKQSWLTMTSTQLAEWLVARGVSLGGAASHDAPVSEVGVSTRKAMHAIEQIVVVMCEKGLRDDIALSEIQDYLTIAGYDVPLRSYAPAGLPSRAAPEGPSEASVETTRP